MHLQSFAQYKPIFFSPTQIKHLIHQGLNDEKASAILLLRIREFNFVRPIKPQRVIDHMHLQAGLLTKDVYFNRQIPPRIRCIANRVIARFYERQFASEQFVLLEGLSGQKITSCKHGAANARQLAQQRKMTRNAESADLSRELAWLLGI